MDKLFQIELQQSLSDLEQNIADITTAKTQIEIAKNTATDVVQAMHVLQQDNANYIVKLEAEIQSFLEKSNTDWQDNLNSGIAEIRDLTILLDDYRKNYLSDTTNLNKQLQTGQLQHLDNITQRNDTFFRNLQGKTYDLLQSVMDKINSKALQLEQNTAQLKKQQEEVVGKLVGNVQESLDRVSEHTEKRVQDLENTLHNTVSYQKETIQLLLKDTNSAIEQSITTIEYQDKEIRALMSGNLEHFQEMLTDLREQNLKYFDNGKELLTDLKQQQTQHFQDLHDSQEQHLLDISDQMNQRIIGLVGTLDEHIGEVNNNYLLLKEQTTFFQERYQNMLVKVEELQGKIGSFDFPQRFGNLENSIQSSQDIQQKKWEHLEIFKKTIEDKQNQYFQSHQLDLQNHQRQNEQQFQRQDKRFWAVLILNILGIILLLILTFS